MSVTSRSLSGISELTVIGDLKSELVPVRETITYATRLRALLRTLFEIRRQSTEAGTNPADGALERIGVLHKLSWSILDDDTRLLLFVAFDGPWEPYIRRIADLPGPILDVILCHCEGYAGHSSDLGYAGFARWARAHQVASEFFFSGPPVTEPDMRHHRELAREQLVHGHHPDFDRRATTLSLAAEGCPLHAPQTRPPHPVSRATDALAALLGLHALSPLFPDEDARFLLRAAQLILADVDFGELPDEVRVRHLDAVEWIEQRLDDAPASPARPEIPVAKLGHVQGDILTPYKGITHGCLLLMRIENPAHAGRTLERLAAGIPLCGGGSLRLTTEERTNDEPIKLNLGFTFAGLRSIGMSERDLVTLPQELREGMEARAGWLGDLRTNHPSAWTRPQSRTGGGTIRLSTVDLVIVLQVAAREKTSVYADGDDHPLHAAIAALERPDLGLHLLAIEPLRRLRRSVGGKTRVAGHFGYVDGVSQPTHEATGPARDQVRLGEILLGYADDHGDPANPGLDVLRDGAFLVVRKLRQDVKRFREVAGLHPETAAKLMGRTRDGEPLVQPTPRDNDFDFCADPGGDVCPLDSHVRRANPRNGPELAHRPRSPRHVPRILRRGLSYGPTLEEKPEESSRGLMFMAYCASITDQFEVIQRWMSGGNSTGVPSERSDPFLGVPIAGESRIFRFIDGNGRVQRVDLTPEPLTRLEWGSYLFVPSETGLLTLAGYAQSSAQDASAASLGTARTQAAEGERILRRLEGLWRVELLRDPGGARERVALAWKKLLEDPSARETSRSVWSAIRARGGAVWTPYGVLVGSKSLVMQVFGSPETYSATEYWSRMSRALGEHYLGMDPDPQEMDDRAPAEVRDRHQEYLAAVGAGRYTRESEVANAWISSISRDTAFKLAVQETKQQLTGEIVRSFPPGAVHLRSLIETVIAQLSRQWFAIPDGKEVTFDGGPSRGQCPDDLFANARYVFSPNPTAFVRNEGQERGRIFGRATLDYVQRAIAYGAVPADTLLEALANASLPHEDIARVLAGAVHGFVGPTTATLLNSVNAWLESELLWRHQQALLLRRTSPTLDGLPAAEAALLEPLIAGMQRDPFPYVLHRTALRETTLGDVAVKPGERVVLGLISATQDEPGHLDVLFGGDRGRADRPTHACPGREMAMGVMLGILSELLGSYDLAPHPGRWMVQIS